MIHITATSALSEHMIHTNMNMIQNRGNMNVRHHGHGHGLFHNNNSNNRDDGSNSNGVSSGPTSHDNMSRAASRVTDMDEEGSRTLTRSYESNPLRNESPERRDEAVNNGHVGGDEQRDREGRSDGNEFYIARKLLRRRHIMKERRELREAQERERRMRKKRSRDENDGDGTSGSSNASSNNMALSTSTSFQRSTRCRSSEGDDTGGSMIGSAFHNYHHPFSPLRCARSDGEGIATALGQHC